MARRHARPVRAARRALLLAVLCAGLSRPVLAGEKIGVVLMHGEEGAPGRVIVGLSEALEAGGYIVGRPDMCWSARRGYEADFPTCLATIDAAVVKLRNLGAQGVVVAGFSLGATAAIAYAATHPDCLGVIALAPDHDARLAARRPEIAASLSRARDLVAAGKGEDTATFTDVAIGPDGIYDSEIATSPSAYLSFFGAESTATVAGHLARLSAPLLWVAGAADPGQGSAARTLFASAPPNPLSRFAVVPGTHLATPDGARTIVLDWLGAVAGR